MSHSATSKKCLEKILPYLRRLYEALASLPEEFVHTGEIYRAEKGVRFKNDNGEPLEKGDTIPFWRFASFTMDPSQTTAFKTTTALKASVDSVTKLIGASPEFTLAERLRQFMRNFACDTHSKYLPDTCDELASRYEDDVAQLNEVLKKRFGKTLPPRGEKQKRTIIWVEKGVGYDIALFSEYPAESEILVEAGTQLEVLENSLRKWEQFGEEEDSNRQQLRTRMLRMVPLLTGGPGSLVRRYVENQVARREFMENLERRLDNGEEIDLFNQPESHGSSVTRERSVDERRLDRRTVQRERVKECLEDLHDFEGASDWLLQVTVKQHDGKDDTVGERIDASKMQTVKNYRLYSVDPGQLLKVTIRNLSLVRTISFTPVYVDCEGDDDPEEAHTLIMLKSGESQELPMALKKDREEKDDGWDLRDEQGTKTLLRLRFTVAQPT